MAENLREYQDERRLRTAESEQTAPDADSAPSVSVSPALAAGMLKGALATAQRQALVQNVGQHYGNKQVQRMLGTVRRSASSGPEGGPLEQDLTQKIQSERSKGQPLDSNVRRAVESSLGADLSQVRIHTDSTAAELNSQMGAKAFTTGRDIFYGEGQSPADLSLTTHEATHTIQQGFSEQAPAAIGAADTVHEQAAHTASTQVSSGVGGVQRETAEDDEVQMMRDPAVQRETAEDDEVQMMRDPAVQRESDEEETEE